MTSIKLNENEENEHIEEIKKIEKAYENNNENKNDIKNLKIKITNNGLVSYRSDKETTIKEIELDNNIILRLLEYEKKIYVDIRKYFKGYPTKKGIRIAYETFKKLKNII